MSHNSETRYIATRFKVPSPKNIKNGRVTGKELGNAEYINQQVNGIIQRMFKIYDTIPNAECYTCSQLLKLIEAKMNKVMPVTFDEIAYEWLDLRKAKIAHNSYTIFERAIKCFSDFAGKGYLLSLLDERKVDSYDEYLSKKKGTYRDYVLSPSTTNLRMRTLRSVVRYAEQRKYVSYEYDPFINYSEKPENIRKAFLDVETIRKIRDIKTDDYNVELTRDIFMLSFYLCGMNIHDMLEVNMRGETISFLRGKTSRRRKDGLRTVFTIQPEARDIINKYMGHDGRIHIKNKTNKSTISNYLTRHLEKIENMVSPRVHLVYYCARKSFAQFANELKVQERVIKYCIGDALNSREKDMLMYYTQTNQQMADEAIRCVLDFVASNKTEESLFQSKDSTK